MPRSGPRELVASDFPAAEFASALARHVRVAHLAAGEARAAFADFDAWTARSTLRVETTTVDVRAAEGFLRRLDLALRTPDALNIAVVRRAGAALATFDEGMATAARALAVQAITA